MNERFFAILRMIDPTIALFRAFIVPRAHPLSGAAAARNEKIRNPGATGDRAPG
jgi:hypothetical protein